MSKLPHAPLVEVIFEIRWNSADKASLDKFQLFLGSMFSELKEDFPNVINLQPNSAIPVNAFVGIPTHRFTSVNNYPMYQLGPGILSVNMINDGYVWESFIETVNKVVSVFEKLSDLQGKKTTLALKYLDFFKVNFTKVDLKDFIKRSFHLSVDAPYLNARPSSTFSFATTYDVEVGRFSMSMNTGYNNVNGSQIEGIICESNVSKEICFEDLNLYIADQLPMAHMILGDFFKDLTAGDFYESFK